MQTALDNRISSVEEAVELNRYAVGGGGFQVGQIQRV